MFIRYNFTIHDRLALLLVSIYRVNTSNVPQSRLLLNKNMIAYILYIQMMLLLVVSAVTMVLLGITIGFHGVAASRYANVIISIWHIYTIIIDGTARRPGYNEFNDLFRYQRSRTHIRQQDSLLWC